MNKNNFPDDCMNCLFGCFAIINKPLDGGGYQQEGEVSCRFWPPDVVNGQIVWKKLPEAVKCGQWKSRSAGTAKKYIITEVEDR